MVTHETPVLVVQQGPCTEQCGVRRGSSELGCRYSHAGRTEQRLSRVVFHVVGGRSHTRPESRKVVVLGSGVVGFVAEYREKS